jgi:putative DNA-invertase from lambdoid prophage Rac
LDRWGRSQPELVVTLRELTDLGICFGSLTESLNLMTPTGRAMAGMVAVFAKFEREILRERVRAGSRRLGRRVVPSAAHVLQLTADRVSH